MRAPSRETSYGSDVKISGIVETTSRPKQVNKGDIKIAAPEVNEGSFYLQNFSSFYRAVPECDIARRARRIDTKEENQ